MYQLSAGARADTSWACRVCSPDACCLCRYLTREGPNKTKSAGIWLYACAHYSCPSAHELHVVPY